MTGLTQYTTLRADWKLNYSKNAFQFIILARLCVREKCFVNFS
jgi:hypothetical protein